MKRKLLGLLLWSFVLSARAMAQATENVRKYTAFDMRSNGKIYVVVVVMLIIMLGLLFYVIRIDRRITRLEGNDKKGKND